MQVLPAQAAIITTLRGDVFQANSSGVFNLNLTSTAGASAAKFYIYAKAIGASLDDFY